MTSFEYSLGSAALTLLAMSPLAWEWVLLQYLKNENIVLEGFFEFKNDRITPVNISAAPPSLASRPGWSIP